MRGLKESKPKKTAGKPPFIPRPLTLGYFLILIIILAFTAGHIKNELGLKLLAAVFSCILAWCFFSVFVLGLVHRKKALSLSAYILPELAGTGETGEIRLALKNERTRFFFFPGAFTRYKMKLETRDGRTISRVFNPEDGRDTFKIKERGAYYGSGDEFFISDAPGFFRLAFPLSLTKESGVPRLLAVPSPLEEHIALPLPSGGKEHRAELRYSRTDELTDHRPYVPGDDPRRINWKLYGHGTMGELFIREGEFEPPPHGKLLILIDTQADGELFNQEEGRAAVDLLCRIALTAALDFSSRGIEISTGYTGGTVSAGSFGEDGGRKFLRHKETALAAALSYPAYLPLSSTDELPGPDRLEILDPEKTRIMILALPRVSSTFGALDRFLRDRRAGEKTALFFAYGAGKLCSDKLQKAAELCVNLYRKKAGLNVRGLSV